MKRFLPNEIEHTKCGYFAGWRANFTLYQGPQTPGDNILAVSLRWNVVWRDPWWVTCSLIWAHVATMDPHLGRM